MSRLAATLMVPFAIAIDANAAPVLVLSLDIMPRKAKYKPPLDRLKY